MPQGETKTHSDGILTKAFYIIALYALFLFSGIFEEKLYKNTYTENKIKFKHPLFAIFCCPDR